MVQRLLEVHRTACLIAVLGLAGCASSAPDPAWGTDFAGRPDNQISVRVVNRQFSDATLFAWSDGSRLRMGTVGSLGTAVFRVPWSGFRPLQIRIRLLSGADFVTPTVDVSEGQQVTLAIETDLTMSTIQR
jgi:hypothetical protein